MDFSLTTPALLFSAISLLLLAFTNRFLALANLIRDLHARYSANPSETLSGQISNLKKRIKIIRNMQLLGVVSFFLCVVSMFCLFADFGFAGKIMFGAALLFLMGALILSIIELFISVDALNLQLEGCQPGNKDCLVDNTGKK
jgi:hypothetical protein